MAGWSVTRRCGRRLRGRISCWPTDAQLLFDRLSVFAGSFDLDAAEAICAGDDLDSSIDDIVDLLGDLVDKSMVNAIRSERGTRYRLLETLRQYGEERLDDRGETAVVRDAHLGHFVTVALRLGQRWESRRSGRRRRPPR